jgi:hypothetical protein
MLTQICSSIEIQIHSPRARAVRDLWMFWSAAVNTCTHISNFSVIMRFVHFYTDETFGVNLIWEIFQQLLFHRRIVTDTFACMKVHSLMELSPSREAANCAATQEIPSTLWNPKGSLPCSQESSAGPCILFLPPSLMALNTHTRIY